MRRGVIASLAATVALAAAAGLGSGAGPARAAVGLGVANGTVNAGADHVAVGSGVFPNFKSGAIDSWVPLAHAHVDNAPFAEGTASPLDTGPGAQTVAGTASKQQPQYAEARHPKADTTADTFGSPGGPYAHVTAVQGSATATAQMAGGGAPAAPGGQSSARSAQLAALDAALQAWRARFLTPLAALAYPAVHPDATEPDGVLAGSSTASVAVDPATGLVDGGDARVGSASFGGGSVLIRNVQVSVSITNAGTPHPTSTVDLGQATVGGVPVSVGSGGVSPGPGPAVPLDQLQQATEQLNAALAKGGLTLRAVAPAVTSSGNQVTVDATGIHVDIQQPPVAPGVPTQFAEHTVGEVFADSLAVPAAPLPELLPLLPVSPVGSATPSAGAGRSDTSAAGAAGTLASSLGGGTSSPSGSTAAPGGGAGARAGLAPSLVATGVRQKPLWLLLLYFMWQALVIGTAVSLWWWRAARVATT